MTPDPSKTLRMWVDFDGTLVEPNVAIILVEEFARNGKVVAHQIDEELHSGKITLREAWERQVALLPADRMTEMAQWAVENTPFRAGAHELLALLAEHQIPTSIVSGGLDFYIDPILQKAGIDLPVFSDMLRLEPSGALRLSHPHGHATCRLCGICKAQTVQTGTADGRRSVFVGDGSTDKYAAEVADIVFARRRLKGYCETSGIPHFAFEEEFGPVTAQLRRWLDGSEPLPPRRVLGLVDSPCPISRASFATA
ncbi:MAG TPA: MtnX-like HAD-IB family phosphatase [Thermoplasmata archaeon]|jgi:2-hydroxy-3-keto-5-methylthiopentenyl-1-phosphate phosphatase|nr:MtnX-like HAD-IB family phosphatase [Thermoplasmata archaeon]